MEQKLPDRAKTQLPDTYIVQLDERGRLVLPMAIRNRLALHPREKLVATMDDNGLRLATLREQVSKAQGILSKISPGRLLSEELIAERRKEAELE